MPSDLDALSKLVKQLSDEFQKEKQLTAKLANEIKIGVGGDQMPKKWFERDVKPLIESAKKMEDARGEIKSQEQTIKRLEREMDILQRELAALKRDALTEADIKPFKNLLK
jgi:chromosome condensin MukBEF ATPase and DNA-binding subunit MukB